MHKKKIVSCLSAAMLLLAQAPAYSAGLGKLSINSALGQPLKAEIEVIAADPTELSNLQARLASSEAYHNANIEMSNALSGVKLAIDKNANGRTVLKLSTTKPINDPFLDMLIELNWGNGQMVREYTLLLDPPGMASPNKSNADISPVITSSDSARSTANEKSRIDRQAVSEARDTRVARTVAKQRHESNTPTRAENTPENIPASGSRNNQAETVGPIKRGETLSAIARETKPEGVKLEQMLVGLYRSNTQAFNGNMNRLKTGQILKIPSKDEVAAISQAEAAREIKLQSADWHNYRQKLAGEVASAPAAADKATSASGKITPKVEDNAALNKPGQDVLKLSKGEAPVAGNNAANGVKAVPPGAAEQKQAAQDEVVAKQKALKDANDRAAALEKNIKDMQRLVELKNQSMADLQKKSGQPAASVVAPPTGTASVTPVKPVQPMNAAPAKNATLPVAPIPVIPGNSWYDDINPLYAGAAAVGALLLALLGFMSKSRRRREGLSKFENSIMTNLEAKPNTVFGTQGGTSVNTNNTSFLTDFSQSGLGNLDTHDVDPIAEAEVYMAYGRDAQAEEILKEAMVKDPARHEIKLKLLEIYATRNNLPAFESVATELYSALGGENTPVWEKAAGLGRKLDPNNPLYGGHAGTAHEHTDNLIVGAAGGAAIGAGITALDAYADKAQPPITAGSIMQEDPLHEDFGRDDQNLDFSSALDFDTDENLQTPSAHKPVEEIQIDMPTAEWHDHQDMADEPVTAAEDTMVPETNTDSFSGLDFDFDATAHNESNDMAHTTAEQPAHETSTETAHHDDDMLNFDFNLDSLDTHHEEGPTVVGKPVQDGESELAPVALDFSGINLDFETPAVEDDAQLSDIEQEVKTKLDLAQVYQEMGDNENAREILQEVLKEGNAEQQASAHHLLTQLG